MNNTHNEQDNRRSAPVSAAAEKNTGPAALDQYSQQPAPTGQSDSPFYRSAAPSISLPKGGGALKGIDEKFTVNPVTGTAGLNVSLPLSPGRGGFTPALSLSYNSGSGNSEFGLGWALSLPAIQRKTDKKLPQYDDAGDSDVFLLAGAEDLVPLLNGSGQPVVVTSGAYTIRQYRPRIEGLFARIEYIRKSAVAGGWWRVTTKDNITTYYGLSAAGRIADPASADRIYKWLPQIITDHKGNVQWMEYIAEDKRQVSALAHEENRLNGKAPFSNQYLKRVQYCNEQPYFIDAATCYEPAFPSAIRFLMEAVLDYGDHSTVYSPAPDRAWTCRSDAFSQYHAGFEIRYYRLCRRVLMFHHFPELAGKDLVRSLDLTYQQDSAPAGALSEADYIVSATKTGYEYSGGTWRSLSLPAMTFDYEPLAWDTELKAVEREQFAGAPQGLTGPYQWIDFDGEGISGILAEQGAGWFYKSNLGGGQFSPPRAVAVKPSFAGLEEGALQWRDIDGDGRRQIVADDQVKGYWELDDDQQWQPFRPFVQHLNIDWKSPFTKMIDLDGDGKADVLMTEDRAWTWWENLGTQGYGTGGNAGICNDEDKGPVLLLRDSMQSIFLADMSGDGLTDLVRIRNGEVCYWPNLGYGKFGARVVMSQAPVFHNPELFNPEHLSLADISGTGAADLIYIGERSCAVWINLSGNGFGDQKLIAWLPSTDQYSKIAVHDFLGNGTGCIVWSSPLPQYAHAPLRYIDLMKGRKPYLMNSYHNGMGKTVSLTYKSSTQFYLADKYAGIPWATQLPFPVQCLHTVTSSDSVSETSYSQTYTYRHGYYDHEEREFRGFGCVENLDTDSAAITDTTDLDQAPVLTKTWYHTGAWMRKDALLDQFQKEYYQFDGWDKAPQAAEFPTGLNAQELREAHRTLKGQALRQEVYALDGSSAAGIPYSVTASAYAVKKVQELGNNRFASFFSHLQHKVVFYCERNAADPRIAHELTLETDEYGNVLRNATVVYPRKNADATLPLQVQQEQAKMRITSTQQGYTNDAIDSNHYHLRLSCEVQTFELLGLSLPTGLWTRSALFSEINAAAVIDFSATPSGGKQKRRLSHTRIRFKDNLAADAPLSFGVLQSLAIPHEQYQLVFTAALRSYCYGSNVSTAMLSEGGYTDLDGDGSYWLPSGKAHFLNATYTNPAQQFFTAVAYSDPWGNSTQVSFGTSAIAYRYWLQPLSVTDALGNTSSVEVYDWRTLQPLRIKDANENLSEIRYDALGLPVAMALLGKGTGSEGDSLSGLDPYNASDVLKQQQFFSTNPDAVAQDLLGNATWRCVYDLSASPFSVGMIARQHHVNNPVIPTGQGQERIVRITYTDGMGRVIMHKIQCSGTTENGNKTWIGSGRTVYNNKGKAVMQFEPYFSSTHHCDTALQAASQGVSPKTYYDPLDRVRRTELPDGTFTKTEWTAWQQRSWDGNDTVKDSAWYSARIGGAMGAELQGAAQKAAVHYNTPTVMHTDTLARVFYTIQQDSAVNFIHSYVNLDIQGNRISIVDGRGKTAFSYRYNMLKQVCYQQSLDSGVSYVLSDVAGQSLYAWDADNRKFRIAYDVLRRTTHKWLNDTILLEHFTYGEGVAGAAAANLRGRVYLIKDGAGTLGSAAYDFKGNILSSVRTYTVNASGHPNWSGAVALESASYTVQTVYDALSRSVRITSPDGGVTTHFYERGGGLYAVRVDNVRGLSSGAVNTISYNAKGQRQKVQYANGTTTTYDYDPQTFRVIRIRTTRHSDSTELQDLRYWYDAAGNVTLQKDLAQQTAYFSGSVATPENNYTYDALYRLIEVSGREHAGNNSAPDYSDGSRSGIVPVPISTGDTAKMRRFTQSYRYDAVGNFIEMKHTVTGGTGNWTRTYTTDTLSNRMTQTVVGGGTPEVYVYDNRGNITGGFAHIGAMSYNACNRLESIVLDSNRTAYYQYDSEGQRARKTIVNTMASTTESRRYAGEWEVYRKQDSVGTVTLERETLHISDDTGRLALIDTRRAGTGSEPPQLMRYQYSNHLGTATLELDQVAAIISYEEYYPYGSTSMRSGRSSAEVSLKRYRYTGKERDEESGLYYQGARYYVSWLGRWTAVDPINNEWYNLLQGKAGRNEERQFTELAASSYEYCYCNPVWFTDPTGEQPPVYGSITGQLNVSLRITIGEPKTKSSNYHLGVGGSLMFNGHIGAAGGQFSLNASAGFTNGGLSSPFGQRRGMFKGVGELILSPSVMVGAVDVSNGPGNGVGASQPMPVNFLHNNATTALTNNLKYSLGYSLNYHFESDKKNKENSALTQRTGTIQVRVGQFSLNVMEDVRNAAWNWTDGEDRFWTGSGNANWQFKDGTMLTAGTDTYTGESYNAEKVKGDNYGDTEVGGKTPSGKTFYWANQTQIDQLLNQPTGYNQSLNNAQTFLQLRMPNGSAFRVSNVGPANFWSQNTIHNMFTPVFHHFKSSTSKNKWQLSYETTR